MRILIFFFMVPLLSFASINRIEYSKKEKKLGLKVARFIDEIKRNRIKKHDISRLAKKIKGQELFSLFEPRVQEFNSIYQSKTLSQLKNSCLFERQASNSLDELLVRKIDFFCLDQFLSLNLKNEDNVKLLNDFFTHYIPYFFEPEFRRRVERKLRKARFNDLTKAIFSSNISSYIIREKKIPSQAVLSFIQINEDLTNYIQENRILSSDHTSRTFKKMMNQFEDSLNSDLSQKQIMQQIAELKKFFKANSFFIQPSRGWYSWSSLGKELLYHDHVIASKHVFKFMINNLDKKYYDESTFLLLWADAFSGNYELAVQTIHSQGLHDKFSELSTKLRFWMAYVLSKSKYKDLSQNYFRLIMKEDPLNYYSIMANKFLQQEAAVIPEETLLSQLEGNSVEFKSIFNWTKLSPNAINSLKRLNIWAKIDHQALIESEEDYFFSLPKNALYKKNEFDHKLSSELLLEAKNYFIARVYEKSRNHLRSFITLGRAINRGDVDVRKKIMEILFPFRYKKRIEKYAPSLDPLVVLSLIRQESAFNPKATSRVGAKGLMQLMPMTARQIKKRVTRRQLERPSINLQIGTKHFNKLFKKYRGNLVHILAAYNAGEHRVKQWQNSYLRHESMLHNIEAIPFRETRNYVKLIFRNLFFYKYLAGEEKDSARLTHIYDVPLTPSP